MPTGAPYRILAIDDVPSNLLTLQAILGAQEFSFHGVGCADDAFTFLQNETVDLILLDVLLPGIDGFEIARRIKATPATAAIPLIFLTSLRSEDEIARGFGLGGVDFITKPFHKTELLLRLRTHLSLRDKNAALEKVATELRQANESRDQFFSILAHDLKNPFAGFLSLLDSVAQGPQSLTAEELTDVLQSMGRTAHNVYRLLENLLDWGRAQTGGIALDPRQHMVSFLVEEALEPLEEGFRAKGVGLHVEPCAIHATVDRYTVVAILRNLLSNALKFTRPGGVVTVHSERSSANLTVSVTDTGVGIAEHRLSQLFRLENKASTPGTAREPGTGLGLILCAEFARKNGGSLAVESREGHGTTFTLSLPLPDVAGSIAP